jgi:hypothetical protein
VQTVNCTDDPNAIQQLKRRIDHLSIDQLRTKLSDAKTGLEVYQDVFQKSANSKLAWPWKRVDKEQAVREFTDNLKELDKYLAALNNSDLPFRRSKSGVGQEALHDILRHIDKLPDCRASSLRKLGEKYRSERDKEPLFERVEQIRSVIEKMQLAFM